MCAGTAGTRSPGHAEAVSQIAAAISTTPRVPLRHTPELHPADGGLHFREPAVAAERRVFPFEARRERMVVDRLVVLAVVLVGPHQLPQVFVAGGDHAALAARGDDLVLAEGPAADIAEGAHGPAAVARPVCLGAVLDDREIEIPCERQHAVHVAGPAGKVYTDDGAGTRGEYRGDGLGRDVLGVAIDVGEHGHGARVDDARDGGEKGAGRDDDFVARADTERPQGEIEGDGAVGQRDSVAGAAEVGVFALELPADVTDSVVGLVGGQHIPYRCGLLVRVRRPGREWCIQHRCVPRRDVNR